MLFPVVHVSSRHVLFLLLTVDKMDIQVVVVQVLTCLLSLIVAAL